MTGDLPRWLRMALPWQAPGVFDADIVLLTEAALARSLWAFPFPDRASEVERRTILGEFVRGLEGIAELATGNWLKLEEVSLPLRCCLQEKGLITLAVAHQPLGAGLILEPALGRAVVVNEEDHLRIKAWRGGFDAPGAVAAALELESVLDRRLEFAFSEEIGYLTACPTRVGTGLRLTSLLHLPGLVMAGEIGRIVNALRQLQFAVHGLAGRSGSVRGCLFLISNLVTLGRSEDEAVEDFALHVGKIIHHERTARAQLYDADPLAMEDLAHRSLATCRHARLMTLQEGFDRLSNLRLGHGLGILPEVRLEDLNRLLVFQQGGHLSLSCPENLQGKELMAARAALFREILSAPGP